MDQYEKLAEEYICGSRIFSVDGDNAKALADAFRWSDERREKVCETPSHIMYDKSWWKYCPVCGRRIVEKEGE